MMTRPKSRPFGWALMLAPFALVLLVLMLSLMLGSCRVRKATNERIESTEGRGFERIERIEGGAVRLTSDSLRITWERFRADGSLEVRGRLEQGRIVRETLHTREVIRERDTLYLHERATTQETSKTEGGNPLPPWAWIVVGVVSALGLGLYLARLFR